MHLFTCKVCNEVKQAPRPNESVRRIWLKENKGTLHLTCCDCFGIFDSDYITIIEEVLGR